jgi:hypothetical protein
MMGNWHHKKDAKVLFSVAGCLALISLIVFLVPELAISGAKNDPEAAALQEPILMLKSEVITPLSMPVSRLPQIMSG